MLSTVAAVLILSGTLLVFVFAVGVLSWRKRQQVTCDPTPDRYPLINCSVVLV